MTMMRKIRLAVKHSHFPFSLTGLSGHGKYGRCFSTSSDLKKTALYDFHGEREGKMVPYAGYSLPVQYPTGVKKEHLHVREKCGLFDVSHMGQVKIYGPDREAFIEKVTPVDMSQLEDNQAQLSVILNEKGGILDDTVITKEQDRVAMVVNGACKDKDLEHLNTYVGRSGYNINLVHEVNRSLLALQGPEAAKILQKYTQSDISKLGFMNLLDHPVIIGGIECAVTRCGYTGEDGFEISVDNEDNGPYKVATELASDENVLPCGLGARDSLRLEAGLCLYGNDLDESRSIVEAGLLWIFSKNRRAKITAFLENEKAEETDPRFIGCELVMSQIKKKPQYKRVGLLIDGAPAREGSEIYDSSENHIGIVTSGTFSPSLSRPLSMGYVERKFKVGEKLKIKVRNKLVDAEICKMPFVPANYYRL